MHGDTYLEAFALKSVLFALLFASLMFIPMDWDDDWDSLTLFFFLGGE